jgi:hypothetical protein
MKPTLALTTKGLCRHINSAPFDQHFQYRLVIGKLNYLEKSMQPNIAFAVNFWLYSWGSGLELGVVVFKSLKRLCSGVCFAFALFETNKSINIYDTS